MSTYVVMSPQDGAWLLAAPLSTLMQLFDLPGEKTSEIINAGWSATELHFENATYFGHSWLRVQQVSQLSLAQELRKE